MVILQDGGIFIDTSFVLAFLSEDDASHEEAIAVTLQLRQARRRYFLTEAILVEIGNKCRDKKREMAVEYIRRCQLDSGIEIIPVDKALIDEAVDLYQHRPDKYYSLTDCISFVVMRTKSLLQALTIDDHFRQEGFTPLLTSKKRTN